MRDNIVLSKRYAESKLGRLTLGQVVRTNEIGLDHQWHNWEVVHIDDMDVILEDPEVKVRG